jgi:hypothetical protein
MRKIDFDLSKAGGRAFVEVVKTIEDMGLEERRGAEVMVGYAVQEETMNGMSLRLNQVWAEHGAARAIAGDLEEEHVSYRAVRVPLVILPDGQAGLVLALFDHLDESTEREFLRLRALAKLSPAERGALGITEA